jgi:endoglucanase
MTQSQVLIFLIFAGSASGATLSLKATWTPNTEPDMAGYNLYRTDGTRLKLNPALIPHPPVLPYSFSLTVPDNSSGTMTFVLTAVDTSGNESPDSNTASKTYDLAPPAAPKAFSITF